MISLNALSYEDTKTKYYHYCIHKRKFRVLNNLPKDLFSYVCRFLGAPGIHDLARTSKDIRHRITKFSHSTVPFGLTPLDFPPKLSLNKNVFQEDILAFFDRSLLKERLPDLIAALPIRQMARVDIKEIVDYKGVACHLPHPNRFKEANAPVLFGLLANSMRYIAFYTRSYYPNDTYIEDSIEVLHENHHPLGINYKYHHRRVVGHWIRGGNNSSKDQIEPLFPQIYSTSLVTAESLPHLPARILQIAKARQIPRDFAHLQIKNNLRPLPPSICFIHSSHYNPFDLSRNEDIHEQKSVFLPPSHADKSPSRCNFEQIDFLKVDPFLSEFGICKKYHHILVDWIDKGLIRKDFDGLPSRQINRILIRSENTSQRLIARSARVAHAFKSMQEKIDVLSDQSMKDRIKESAYYSILNEAVQITKEYKEITDEFPLDSICVYWETPLILDPIRDI